MYRGHDLDSQIEKALNDIDKFLNSKDKQGYRNSIPLDDIWHLERTRGTGPYPRYYIVNYVSSTPDGGIYSYLDSNEYTNAIFLSLFKAIEFIDQEFTLKCIENVK